MMNANMNPYFPSRSRYFIVLFIVVWVSVLIASVHSEDFHPERTRLVDYDPVYQNFLFRGNQPTVVLTNNTEVFIYDELLATLKNVTQASNLTLPKNFTIYDLSFENVFNEREVITEKEFFLAHPNLGVFNDWVIVGDLENPDKLPEELRKLLAETLQEWQYDKLVTGIPSLYNIVHSKHATPLLVYIHCEAGLDRTGEVSGSYYIKYLKWTFQEALTFDYKVGNRPIKEVSQNAFTYYCWYLYYTTGFPTDCDWLPS